MSIDEGFYRSQLANLQSQYRTIVRGAMVNIHHALCSLVAEKNINGLARCSWASLLREFLSQKQATASKAMGTLAENLSMVDGGGVASKNQYAELLSRFMDQAKAEAVKALNQLTAKLAALSQTAPSRRRLPASQDDRIRAVYYIGGKQGDLCMAEYDGAAWRTLGLDIGCVYRPFIYNEKIYYSRSLTGNKRRDLLVKHVLDKDEKFKLSRYCPKLQTTRDIDQHCKNTPYVYKNRIYFQGGPKLDRIFSKSIHDTEDQSAKSIDYSDRSPAVHRDYVYWRHQSGKLYRRRIDGGGSGLLINVCDSRPYGFAGYVFFLGRERGDSYLYKYILRSKELVKISDICVGPPVCSGIYVFYPGPDNTLYRRRINHQSDLDADARHKTIFNGEKILDNCYETPGVFDGLLYYRGGPGGKELRQYNSDSGEDVLIAEKCDGAITVRHNYALSITQDVSDQTYDQFYDPDNPQSVNIDQPHEELPWYERWKNRLLSAYHTLDQWCEGLYEKLTADVEDWIEKEIRKSDIAREGMEAKNAFIAAMKELNYSVSELRDDLADSALFEKTLRKLRHAKAIKRYFNDHKTAQGTGYEGRPVFHLVFEGAMTLGEEAYGIAKGGVGLAAAFFVTFDADTYTIGVEGGEIARLILEPGSEPNPDPVTASVEFLCGMHRGRPKDVSGGFWAATAGVEFDAIRTSLCVFGELSWESEFYKPSGMLIGVKEYELLDGPEHHIPLDLEFKFEIGYEYPFFVRKF